MSENETNYQTIEKFDTINFSYNWNSKLNCSAFTTIRVKNDKKYQMGKVYQISLADKPLKHCKIIAIQYFLLKNLNEFMAQIDTGYSRAETINILSKMYGQKALKDDFIFSIILLKTVKP